MSPRLEITLLLLLTATLTETLAASVIAAPVTSAPLPPPQRISPEIVNELKDFIDLIPSVTVDEIIAKHFIVDGGFRIALKYLRSSQFVQLQRQLEQIPEIIEILVYLNLLEAQKVAVAPHVTCELPAPFSRPQLVRPLDDVVDGGSAELEIVLLDARTTTTPILAAYDLHSFSSFVEELLQHLPHDNYVQMINAKRLKSTAFATFYTSLRSAQLQPMVQSAMQAPNLANAIKTLSGNDIDVKSLEPLAFQVISWGPAI